MTLARLEAFTLTDDHKAQEKIWKELPPWARGRADGDPIRDALTTESAAADSKLAKFVGLDAYKEAGGTIRTDLFADADEIYLDDAALLMTLAQRKLEEAAAPLDVQSRSVVTH